MKGAVKRQAAISKTTAMLHRKPGATRSVSGNVSRISGNQWIIGELMEDHELVARVREGDPDAINAIVDAYKGPLFAFILRMTGNKDNAEDLFQETWLKVVKYIGNFRGDSKLSTWLFQIALNLVRDSERKKKRWKMEPIDDFSQNLSKAPDVDPIKLLEASQVKEMIDSLPVKMREVVILRYYHELNDREISAIAGCPEGTVKSRFFRASDIMRKKWTHMQKEPEYR